jgi:PleD family two-component response regulator
MDSVHLSGLPLVSRLAYRTIRRATSSLLAAETALHRKCQRGRSAAAKVAEIEIRTGLSMIYAPKLDAFRRVLDLSENDPFSLNNFNW